MPQTPEDAVGVTTPDHPQVSAAQIIDYLRRHPDFLQRHPELLDGQLPPGRCDGDRLIDLQQFMVMRLRHDLARLRADQDDLLANSRDNLSTQDRVHRAALALLSARSLEHLIETVTTDLAVLLDVDVVTLGIEATEQSPHRARIDGIQILEPGTVDSIIGPDRAVLLRDDVRGDELIFAGAAGLVRSDALLRLSVSQRTPNGVLAFGTRHPGYFNPGQGTELLGFLARVLEHCIRTWLDLPE